MFSLSLGWPGSIQGHRQNILQRNRRSILSIFNNRRENLVELKFMGELGKRAWA